MKPITQAKISLVRAVSVVISAGLGILGVTQQKKCAKICIAVWGYQGKTLRTRWQSSFIQMRHRLAQISILYQQAR